MTNERQQQTKQLKMCYKAINKGCWEHLQPDEEIQVPCQGLKGKNTALGLSKPGEKKKGKITLEGNYLFSGYSGTPAAVRVARYCCKTTRMLFTKPLERGKSGNPISG